MSVKIGDKNLSFNAFSYALGLAVGGNPQKAQEFVSRQDTTITPTEPVEEEYSSPFDPGMNQALKRYRSNPDTLKEFKKAKQDEQFNYMMDKYSGPNYRMFNDSLKNELKDAYIKRDSVRFDKIITDYFTKPEK